MSTTLATPIELLKKPNIIESFGESPTNIVFLWISSSLSPKFSFSIFKLVVSLLCSPIQQLTCIELTLAVAPLFSAISIISLILSIESFGTSSAKSIAKSVTR